MNNKGMTLIEIIIAIGLIGVLAAGSVAIFTATYTSVLTSGQREQEIQNARIHIERAIVSDAYVSTQITRSPASINIFGRTVTGTLIISNTETTNEHISFFKPN
ncbi:MAG: prepilin-type N-terminal cleavage/methylation domain-containing protein [Clostridiales bacterium]|nr:prepilin-type N-terminal cleavage/methylation domain-containing protein [Clostridiales bacterium]